MPPNPEAQLITTALLLTAAYLTYVCPCRKLLKCHQSIFYSTVVGALIIVTREIYF